MNTCDVRKFREAKHPVLAVGNLIEGALGVVAIGLGVYNIVVYGWALGLLLSFFYTVVVTVIALMSAYHLA